GDVEGDRLGAAAGRGDVLHHRRGTRKVSVGVDDDVQAVGGELAADRAAEVAAATGDEGAARGCRLLVHACDYRGEHPRMRSARRSELRPGRPRTFRMPKTWPGASGITASGTNSRRGRTPDLQHHGGAAFGQRGAGVVDAEGVLLAAVSLDQDFGLAFERTGQVVDAGDVQLHA